MTEDKLNKFYIDFVDVYPVPFEGAKVMVNKGLSNHFQISHSMTMSSMVPSCYKFGCTYVGTKQFSPTEVRLFLFFLYEVLILPRNLSHNVVVYPLP